MPFTQVLVIEDDEPIRLGVCDVLTGAGFAALAAASGEAGLALIESSSLDLVLLDIVLPGRDGLSVLQVIREVRPSLPVILLTARGDVADRVRGLQLGADDYVVKPFNAGELLARVEAVLRRTLRTALDRLKLSDGREVDFERREICSPDGTLIELSEREADLLRYLCSRPGEVISRDELIRQVWQMNPRGLETRTVDMHIVRLRDKLGDDAESPQQITTVRGRGYLFQSGGGNR
jgi:two-component system, OmpR family, alkaline phosphatase synthesis response regulator PhoP